MKFIRTVVNMSYSNLQDFKQFGEDATLKDTDVVDLIRQVQYFYYGSVDIAACTDSLRRAPGYRCRPSEKWWVCEPLAYSRSHFFYILK
jgi:hypothetical protein